MEVGAADVLGGGAFGNKVRVAGPAPDGNAWVGVRHFFKPLY
jgi:hypothetical protein